jgi:hypothetical protein
MYGIYGIQAKLRLLCGCTMDSGERALHFFALPPISMDQILQHCDEKEDVKQLTNHKAWQVSL